MLQNLQLASLTSGLAILLVLSLILLVVATATFKRVEASFAKVL